MKTLSLLLGFAAGQPLPSEDDGPARRLQLGLVAWLLAIVCAAIYGAAAGLSQWHLALTNLLKVPAVVLLASLAALPAGFLAWKLSGARIRGRDLLLGFASSTFAGTMVLAATAPLVLLYYNTSVSAGPMLGVGAVFLALFTGSVLFLRCTIARAGLFRAVAVPVAVILAFKVASLVQLVALASPILPEVTVFDSGIDRVLQ